MIPHNSFTPVQKREALQKVLGSDTFARSEQLRQFLKYVCEMEIEGRGSEINEYLIGVDVLHRPEGYSPGNDSSVRSRAYELRHRLERYYETESPDGPVRIELPKGSYIPAFVDGSMPRPAANHASVAEPLVEQPRQIRRYWPLIAAFVGGGVTVLAAGSFWMRGRSAPPVESVVREAWGPLSQPFANVLVCIGSTLHMNVRPHWQETPGGAPRFDALPELYPLYRKQRWLNQGVELFMHPTENSLDFGELKAVVTVTNMLRSLGVPYQLMPERVTSVAALQGRNTVLLGNSLTSSIAHEELLRATWTIDFEPQLGRVAIMNQKTSEDRTPFQGEYGHPGEPTWCCGLITVLPSEGAAGARTVIISGVTPTGTEAAMQYFSSAASLRDLRQRFVHDGLRGFPTAYQVVVKCKSKDTFLLASDYVTHRILAR